MAEEQVNEEQVLFPEVTIAGILVKPWSFGVLFDISSLLDSVITKVEEKHVDIDFTSGFISYMTMAKLFSIASPEVLKIICITTGKLEEEIKALSMEDGTRLAMVIFQQNKTTLKNALSLLR